MKKILSSLMMLISLSASSNDYVDPVYEVSSNLGSLSGYLITADPSNPASRRMQATNVVAHIKYGIKYNSGLGDYTYGQQFGGVIELASLVDLNKHVNGKKIAEACFTKPIPTNVSMLVTNGNHYDPFEIVIPEYRNDRMCIEVPFEYSIFEGGQVLVTEIYVMID